MNLDKSQTLQKNLLKPDQFYISNILEIIQNIETSSSSKDFFNCLCHLSALIENLEEAEIIRILRTKNIYISFLSAVLTNKIFSEELVKNLKKEIDLEKNIQQKKFINTGLTLAFFPVALILSSLNIEDIESLRRQITKLIYLNLKIVNDENISFTNLCLEMENISWDYRYSFKDKFPVQLDLEFLFNTLIFTRSLIGISLLALTINTILAKQFLNINRLIENGERFNLLKNFENIYGGISRIEKGFQSYYERIPSQILPYFKNFFNIYIRNNEQNMLFFIKEITSNLYYQEGEDFFGIIQKKLDDANLIKERLSVFAQENLAAFTGKLKSSEREWSNKLFITSIKCISTLVEINKAKDQNWKLSATTYILIQWIKETHEIINLQYLEDEFALIKDFLEKEDVKVEWKSTFLTPIEQEFINTDADLALGKKLFLKIVKTILAMLNTEGGVLIIGFIENPEKVLRRDLLKNIIERNGKSFFNIGHELKEKNKTLDQIRLEILENLKNITQNSEEKFNNLFTLDPILLKDRDKVITIIKISVKKALSPIFSIQEDKGAIWISLTKRADGKTINVDVRDYIKI